MLRRGRRRGVARWPALVLAVAAAAACGLPTDETAQAIDPEELPESLRPGFTASTTTTVPAPLLTEPRIVYLLTNPQDIERTIVVEVERQVNRGATLEDVLATLFGEATSPEESDAGYFNTLELFEILSARVVDGVATVDIVHLSPEGEDQPPSADELEFAAAQMVFTASATEGVDGVRILLDGQEVSVPTSDADAEPGSVLRTSAYEQFQPDFAPATTTSAPADDRGERGEGEGERGEGEGEGEGERGEGEGEGGEGEG
ncbi:MAG: GerMN domain-containing protein [Acidimicrobiaceae bacterium]|nr:GerMN domain-containing protein [Acidimicrobiaceae bacterium]